MVEGKGQNQLGSILKNVRYDIHLDRELFRWFYFTFDVQENAQLCPIIQIECYKEDAIIETFKLKDKSFYIFGKIKDCDYNMAHRSISRRHCVIITDKKLGTLLIDLGSKGKTYINGQEIEQHHPYVIKDGDLFTVGESTRSYKVTLDYANLEAYLVKKKKNLETDMELLKLMDSTGVNDEDFVKASLGIVKNDTIFVSNLPEFVSDNEMRKIFENFGKVLDIRVPIERLTGKSKGIAFIKYDSEESAKNAYRAVTVNYGDRKLKIRFAEKDRGQIINELKSKNNLLGKMNEKDKLDVIRKKKNIMIDDYKGKRDRDHKKKDSRKRRRSRSQSSSSKSQSSDSDSQTDKNPKRRRHRSKDSRKKKRSRSRKDRRRSKERSKDRKRRVRKSRSRSRRKSHSRSRSDNGRDGNKREKNESKKREEVDKKKSDKDKKGKRSDEKRHGEKSKQSLAEKDRKKNKDRSADDKPDANIKVAGELEFNSKNSVRKAEKECESPDSAKKDKRDKVLSDEKAKKKELAKDDKGVSSEESSNQKSVTENNEKEDEYESDDNNSDDSSSSSDSSFAEE